MYKDLLDLCVIFAHKIEDQEQTIEELQEIIKDLQKENKIQCDNRNIGHWIPVEKDYYECSKCHEICYRKFPFCPIWGARMKEVKFID